MGIDSPGLSATLGLDRTRYSPAMRRIWPWPAPLPGSGAWLRSIADATVREDGLGQGRGGVAGGPSVAYGLPVLNPRQTTLQMAVSLYNSFWVIDRSRTCAWPLVPPHAGNAAYEPVDPVVRHSLQIP